MELSITEEKLPFRPFTLNITVETLEEAVILQALGNPSGNEIKAHIRNMYPDYKVDIHKTSTVSSKIYHKVGKEIEGQL